MSDSNLPCNVTFINNTPYTMIRYRTIRVHGYWSRLPLMIVPPQTRTTCRTRKNTGEATGSEAGFIYDIVRKGQRYRFEVSFCCSWGLNGNYVRISNPDPKIFATTCLSRTDDSNWSASCPTSSSPLYVIASVYLR